nr:site-specific DNA-methyltransferase [uncultured Janthinobacterium sp.]
MPDNNNVDSKSEANTHMYVIRDVKPATPVAAVSRELVNSSKHNFPVELVGKVTGMSSLHIKRILGHGKKLITSPELLLILDQDSFSETFVPRSKVQEYLIRTIEQVSAPKLDLENEEPLIHGCALDLIGRLPSESIQCVVTSTPYWAMRLYEDMQPVYWADGEFCPFGMEQTPEGFIRHSTEILAAILPALKMAGSAWWNIMDTYNTRTQIRSNASEALQAMQGKDSTAWNDHACRRYSAGHSYLKDGEQCMIPYKIAERASRLGYYVKSVISWTKTSSLPEPQNSRVSRSVEYILHLAKQRTPYFNKEAYGKLPAKIGGRNGKLESAKLCDFWHLPTSSGRDGHGAQFNLALPGRCIALTSEPGDIVLDPFLGAGTSAIAAKMLNRNYFGFDISSEYLAISKARLDNIPSIAEFNSVEETECVNVET